MSFASLSLSVFGTLEPGKSTGLAILVTLRYAWEMAATLASAAINRLRQTES